MPRKRSAGENGNMSAATTACRIKINAAGDWQVMPPAGQITQIGDAVATTMGLVANDDLLVTGKIEIAGTSYHLSHAYFQTACMIEGWIDLNGDARYIKDSNKSGSSLYHNKGWEEITIAVGQGAAGINTAANLAVADSIIVAVAVRVTQAPGGGATIFQVGRTGGNIDEFIQNLAVALGTIGTSAADGDGVNAGPVHNAANNTFVVTTDANVLVSDMKIRICVWYRRIVPPAS